ncbi:MAG: amidohydrolase [Thermodesulfobacteriota bacterium]
MEKTGDPDLIIYNVSILPTPQVKDLIPQGWISIKNGYIIDLQGGNPLPARAQHIIDGHKGLAMPGLINAHTHAAMSLFRGWADDLPWEIWLKDYIFPAENKLVNEDFVFWGSLLACGEMIACGTTTFADGYFFEDQVAQAVELTGLRAVLGQGILDFPTPDATNPNLALKRAERFIENCQNFKLITPALFPHAVYTCSPSLLRRCRDLAEEYGVPLIIHLAETKSELAEVSKRYGLTPVHHLHKLGLLSSNLIACHCVWLNEEEMDLLAERGVRVVHNPESNMKLASGVAPVPDLLARGVVVGLGTDGCASNNNLDLFQEMDTAAKLHKVFRLDPTVMPAEAVLHMATLGGAKVLGMEEEIGSLAVGKKADIIILDLDRPHLQPIYNIVSHLVYAASGADVRHVIINGQIIMKDRQILTLDKEEIRKEAKIWANRICRS